MNESEKNAIRKSIANQKKKFPTEVLKEWSDVLWKKFEETSLFRESSTILLYHSLPDEVYTHDIIERWNQSKKIILPVVTGSELELKLYTGAEQLRMGSFQIKEPMGSPIGYEISIDLALIPGVSFDLSGNRLGRGKGFYDKLLKRIRVPKIGICFQFQVRDTLPTNKLDVPMSQIWSEQGRVF